MTCQNQKYPKPIYLQMMLYFKDRSRIEMVVPLWKMTLTALPYGKWSGRWPFTPKSIKLCTSPGQGSPSNTVHTLRKSSRDSISGCLHWSQTRCQTNLDHSHKPSHCKVNKNTKLCNKKMLEWHPNQPMKLLIGPWWDQHWTIPALSVAPILTNRIEIVWHRAACYVCSRYHK